MRKLLAIAVFALGCLQLSAQTNRTVSGTVSDEKGAPLVGVTINALSSDRKVASTSVSDVNGKFSINVSGTVRSLQFVFIGLEEQIVSVAGKSTMAVKMLSSSAALSEVVVVGYGTQKRKEVTGSLSTVKGKDVADKPVQSFEQALGGRAAGVQITIPNGVLNNPPVIRIRGTNSISLSSYPLIVIDGIPSFTGDQSSVNAAANPLASINPSDIESIDIAKDAAAGAIYGSRAANGVIFVTTKKGRIGRSRVNYDGNVTWSKAQRLPVLLNAQQYTDIKNEGLVNAGTFNATSNAYALTTGPNGSPIDTKWYDYIYRNGLSHTHNINISGANESTSYYFSFGYSKQQGIIQRNDFERKTMLGNIESRVNKWLTLGSKISYSNQMNLSATSSGSLPGEAFNTNGLARAAVLIAPNVSPYNNDGSYNTNASGLIGVMGNKVGQVGFYNPVPTMDLNRSNAETGQLQGNVSVMIKPVSWATLRSVYGVDYQMVDNEVFASPLSGEGFPIGSASSNFNKNKRWVWTNTVQFDYTFAGRHAVSLLGGTEQQKSDNQGYGLTRTTISDPFFTNIQGGFGTVALAATSNNIGENYLTSGFGRLTYNYDKKYFIAGNFRRDGASQFGENGKFGNFWGVSAGWDIDKEGFWTKAKLDHIFTSFKIKGGYGVVGNVSGLGNYSSLSLYGAGLYAGSSTLGFTSAGNPSLSWETSKKTDVGITFGILKDRINAEVAYYNNNIDNLILFVTQPPSAGLPNSIPTNVGTMYNRGFEFALNTVPVQAKDFTWTSNFNIAYNKNEVTSLAPTLPSLVTASSSLESVNITKPGYAIGTLYVTRTGGIDPTTGRRIFINAAGKNVYFQHVTTGGAPRFAYADGTTAPSVSSADAAPYLNTNPKFSGGWENTFRYKEFELNALFTYQLGFYMYYGSRAGMHDQRFWNNEADILGRWTKAGDNATYPRVIAGDNISNGSSFPLDINVFKGDFLKLRTVTLSYNVPKRMLDKVKFNSARLFVSGNNLLIITKYPGPDPESSSNGNGAQNQGVDRNQVPNARAISVGLNIGF